ncbi:MAG: MFS transporter [bacterium]|nr:MFS transporter [bacterium]
MMYHISHFPVLTAAAEKSVEFGFLPNVVAALCVFGFGMVAALIGAIKLRLAERLQIDDARVGNLIMVWALASIPMIVVVGMLSDKFGYLSIIIPGLIVTAAAMLLIGSGKTYAAVVVGALVLAVGGSCVNSAGNTLLVVLNPGKGVMRQNFGNIFFGLGAMTVPLLTAYLFKRMKFPAVLGALAGIMLLPLILSIPSSYPAAGEFLLSETLKRLVDPFVLVGGLALLFYAGVEGSMGGWLTTFFKDAGFQEGQASALLSTFWISLLSGRLITALLLAGNVLSEDQAPWVVLTVSLIIATMLLVMSAARSKPLAVVAAIIIGLSAGPVFPTSIGFILKRYPGQSGVVFGAVFAILMIGGAVIPMSVGHVSKASSIRKGLLIVAASAVMLAVMSIILGVMPLPEE